MDLSSLLPERSIEDILAERVRLRIGGEDYTLPALNIDDNERWKSGLEGAFTGLMVALENAGDDVGTIVGLLTRDPDWLIAQLRSYDTGHVLPDDETIRRGMTPIGLLRAVGEVWRAANPLADTALVGLMSGPSSNVTPLPTSASRRSTAGRRAKSAAS